MKSFRKLAIAMLLLMSLFVTGCAPLNFNPKEINNSDWIVYADKVYDHGYTGIAVLPYYMSRPNYDHMSKTYRLVMGGYKVGGLLKGDLRGVQHFWWVPDSIPVEAGDLIETHWSDGKFLDQTGTDLNNMNLVKRVICRKADKNYNQCVADNQKYIGKLNGEPTIWDNDIRRLSKSKGDPTIPGW